MRTRRWAGIISRTSGTPGSDIGSPHGSRLHVRRDQVFGNSAHSRTHHSTVRLLSSVTFWEMSVLFRLAMSYSRSL